LGLQPVRGLVGSGPRWLQAAERFVRAVVPPGCSALAAKVLL